MGVDEIVEVVDTFDVVRRGERGADVVADRAVDDDASHGRQVRQQPAEGRGQGVVDDDDLVAGMGGDVTSFVPASVAKSLKAKLSG